MNRSLRSKQGCWTCRLRKKKCDEGHPHCSTCEGLSIPCYGFGPKPEWMDNGEKERAVLDSFKRTVKQTSRRKTASESSKRPDPIVRIAPKFATLSEDLSSSEPASRPQVGAGVALDHASVQERGVSMPRVESVPSSPNLGDECDSRATSTTSPDDFILLMHFLDSVFPLQYPMYKPEISEGGRGWLLSLLLRAKPFYHAALTTSAYHRRSVILAKVGHSHHVPALAQPGTHSDFCVKLAGQLEQIDSLEIESGMMAAVVQSVFLELFSVNGNKWRSRLDAAVRMYQNGYGKNIFPFRPAEYSSSARREDRSFSESDTVAVEEAAIYRFLTLIIVWLDIISSITVGRSPQLLRYHTQIVTADAQMKFEKLMGCENWVMLLIGRIAALQEIKIQAMQQEEFDCSELRQDVADIGRQIQDGLSSLTFGSPYISEKDSTSKLATTIDSPRLVTHIFAYTASIYLHLVTEGFENLEVLSTTISEAISLLQTQTSAQTLPAFVTPLYIIGSVARQEEIPFFRDIFSSPPVLDLSLRHRERILPVLEEIWSKRQTGSFFAWDDSLELTQEILLI